MKILIKAFVVLFLLGCNTEKVRNLEHDDFNFRITDDTGLFFKNVRQLYYEFQEIPPRSNRYVYRLKSRDKSDGYPGIYPTLMIDLIKSEASILIEPNAYPQMPLRLNVRVDCSEGEETFVVLDERGRENMLEFANRIYDAIRQGCRLYVEIEQEFVPLLATEESKEAYKKTMEDYYRLVRLLK